MPPAQGLRLGTKWLSSELQPDSLATNSASIMEESAHLLDGPQTQSLNTSLRTSADGP